MKHVLSDQEKQVAQEVISTFDYGQLIEIEWLHGKLNHPSQDMKAAQYLKATNAYYDRLKAVSNYLLEEHQIMLDNSKGKGYLLVNPSDQTDLAVSKFSSILSRAGKDCVSRLTNVRVDRLSDKDKAHNANTRASIGRMIAMQKEQTLNLSLTSE